MKYQWNYNVSPGLVSQIFSCVDVKRDERNVVSDVFEIFLMLTTVYIEQALLNPWKGFQRSSILCSPTNPERTIDRASRSAKEQNILVSMIQVLKVGAHKLRHPPGEHELFDVTIRSQSSCRWGELQCMTYFVNWI